MKSDPGSRKCSQKHARTHTTRNGNATEVKPSNASKCEETCKVVHSGEAKTVKVERKSGSDGESCALVEGICQDSCCKAKCSGESYDLKGDLGGQVQFQECEAGSVKSFWSGSRLVTESRYFTCEETCKVVHSGESKTVKVKRPSDSGNGKQSCALLEGICEESCCEAKCSGESYELKTKWKGKYQFQDCRLQPGGGYLEGLGTLCPETCTVHHSQNAQEVQVARISDSSGMRCEIVAPDLQEIAAIFVEQLEKEALRLSGDYGKLPMMKTYKVAEFLKKVQEEVLSPEKGAAGGFGYSREIPKEAQSVAIIGDLHGQLFNLIAYLLEIKEKYKDKGFSSLSESSLLFCDPRMKYVFMGDYVDRGERGVELLMLVLAYKARLAKNIMSMMHTYGSAIRQTHVLKSNSTGVAAMSVAACACGGWWLVRCPQGLIVLQGNHETPEMWERYGFAEELRYKFNGAIPEYLVQSVTETLPYVAVLPGHWVAMHGGISPSFVKKCSGKAGRFGSCLDRTIGESLVWADPHDGDGFIESNRGPGRRRWRRCARGEAAGGNRRHRPQDVIDEFGKFTGKAASAMQSTGVSRKASKAVINLEGNDGAIFLLDIGGSSEPFSQALNMSGSKARKLARDFTGATCRGGGLIETSQTISSLESFIEENHKHLHHGNSSCSLDQEEAANFQEEVRRALTSSNDPEFEARKLIDLQGEALVHGMQESSFICKSMMKDHLTLKVYKELQVADAEVLEHDIETRRDELLSESTDVEA
eukprot:Skav216636  [mRNA]  locus=scaffold1255:147905:154122:+ [translate_table: standard]